MKNRPPKDHNFDKISNLWGCCAFTDWGQIWHMTVTNGLHLHASCFMWIGLLCWPCGVKNPEILQFHILWALVPTHFYLDPGQIWCDLGLCLHAKCNHNSFIVPVFRDEKQKFRANLWIFEGLLYPPPGF